MQDIASPNPVVQFRLRTLLAVTTGLAVLAAILGPYYRSLEPAGQRCLLAFWSIFLAWTALSLWLQLRSVLRRTSSRQARYVVYIGRRNALGSGARLFLLVITSSAVLFYVGFNSWLAGQDVINLSSVSYTNPLLQGFVLGGWTASVILALVKQPVLLAEEGIPMHARHVIPWQYIRGAEWLGNHPGTMKLRRYDGDIYIEVPAAIRDDVEAFIREKIGGGVMTSANN
jgi:ABC-type iron transport system FetAB permease component